MTNPRSRNQVLGRSYATQPARLAGLGTPSTGNPALDQWIAAVNERLEVREGSRGNPFEKVVTERRLQDLGLLGSPPDPVVDLEQVKNTSAFRSITERIEGIENLKDLPAQVRALLKQNILEEASKRGADIRELSDRIQTASESLAYTVHQVTASLASSAAGVKRVEFASSTATSALAGIVDTISTTVAGNTATITVQGVSINGLQAQYTVKIDVNGYAAGYGLASTPVNGTPFSEFNVRADKFSIQTIGYAGQYPFVVQNVNGVPQLSVASAMIADLAIGSGQVAQHLNSTNFNGTFNGSGNILTYGTAGWAIDKSGLAVFSNVKVRGDVEATSINGVAVDTANIQSGAISSAYPASNTVGGTTCSTATVTVPSGCPAVIVMFDPGFSYSSGAGKDAPSTMLENAGHWTITGVSPSVAAVTFYAKTYVFTSPIAGTYAFAATRVLAGSDTTSMHMIVMVLKR